MLEKLKTIVLTEEQVDREIYRIQNLIQVSDTEEALMYLNGKLESLNWIKKVQLNG